MHVTTLPNGLQLCPQCVLYGRLLFGALLLCLHWIACPVQIKAHHHTDVYADINDYIQNTTMQMFHVVVM